MTAMAVAEVASNGNGIQNVTGDLTPAESRHFTSLERKIERGLSTFREVGEALLEVREKRLYRMTHATFESYCADRWQLARARAYQLMGAAEVATMLGDGRGPLNESQARELVPVFHTDPSLVPKVWKAVQETGEPITGPVIRRVAAQVAGFGPISDARSPSDALIARIDGVYAAVANWRKDKPPAKDRHRVRAALDNLCSLANGG